MPDPTEALSTVQGVSTQGQAAVAVAPKPLGGSSGTSAPSGDTLPRQDTVEISDVARAAAGNAAPKVRTGSDAPAVGQRPNPGRAPERAPVSTPRGGADALHFNFDPKTNTVQTQIVDPKTGKPIIEIPSDEQVKLQANLRKFMKSKELPAPGAGNGFQKA